MHTQQVDYFTTCRTLLQRRNLSPPCAPLAVNKSLSIDLGPEGVTSVLLHPGYVRTDMTGWEGNIDTQTCVKGE